MGVTRRQFLQTSTAAVGLGLLGGCASAMKGDFMPKPAKRVVVIGGGWGGATAAKYVRLADPTVEVVLLEPNKQFISCPFSNLVLSGVRTLESITFGYDGLRGHGVKVLHAPATAIEADARRVRVGEGYLQYDRVIVSPGIDFIWNEIEGVGQGERVLHAWKAGEQTTRLARELAGMPDGGVVVLTVPPVAYRCPPGPYERISQIAWFLKNKKPKSKLVVLDANQNIVSKAALFREAWKAYPNIDYRANNKVTKVDFSTKDVTTEFGDKVKFDVLNLIPPQRAGAIAVGSGLAGDDKRWCVVDHVTYESKARNVHVIGDATAGLPSPKSGNVANAMGKICASAVVNALNDRPQPPMAPGNTCYSFVSDAEAIAVVNAYRIDNGKVVQIEQKLTPAQSTAVARNALGWAASIWHDVLG